MDWFDVKMEVFANTGCVFAFYPLFVDDDPECKVAKEVVASAPIGWLALDDFVSFDADAKKDAVRFRGDTSSFLAYAADSGNRSWREGNFEGGKPADESLAVGSRCHFFRHRLASKKFITRDREEKNVYGLEFAFETTSSGDADKDRKRGFFYSEEMLSDGDKRRSPDTISPPLVYHQNHVRDRIRLVAAHTWSSETESDADEQCRLQVRVEVEFKKPDAERPLDVDVVVDIGNTRTVALLVRQEQVDDGGDGRSFSIDSLRTGCRPVMLQLDNRNVAITPEQASDVRNGVVSSWFVLQEPEFSEFENQENGERFLLQSAYETRSIKKGWWPFRKSRLQNFKLVNRIPYMFVRSSPVVLGDSALHKMTEKSVVELVRSGRRIQQSSPKRYFADNERTTTYFWKMIPKDITNADPDLAANVLYWLNESGEFVDRETVSPAERPLRAPVQASYPRATTLVWMLVAILERAWEQCNRGGADHQRFLQYDMKNVIITYPAGWTRDEVNLYRTRCEQAVEIFERSTFGTKNRIAVNTQVDEAVASQMPYVFSEIHRLHDKAENWMALTGRVHGRSHVPSVRMMNLDVGGGTSDIAIVEYRCSQQDGDDVVLTPRLLFKDGFAVAGDEMMRRVICDIIVPAVDKCLRDHEAGFRIKNLFSPGNGDRNARRSLYVKQCLIPLALHVICDVASGGPEKIIRDCGKGVLGNVDPQIWKDFGGFVFQRTDVGEVPQWWAEMKLEYDPAQVSEILRELFGASFREIARKAVEYDVDVFFMSGKTSEMPDLYELAKESLPLALNRIVTARDYYVGSWYPFADDKHRIFDAKSVTAVGAAVHHLLHSGRIKGWRMAPLAVETNNEFEWGRLEDLRNGEDGYVIRPGRSWQVKLRNGEKIGKRLSLSDGEEPVYRFVNRSNPFDRAIHVVTIGKQTDPMGEGLILESIDGEPAGTTYALVVDQSRPDQEEFWQDSGIVFRD